MGYIELVIHPLLISTIKWVFGLLYYGVDLYLMHVMTETTFKLIIAGKKPSQVIVRRGIRLVIHAVSKVKVISYGDGMDAHQRKVDLSKTIICGT